MIDTIYHVGHLAQDRGSEKTVDMVTSAERAVDRKARLVMLAAVRGEAELYQRRCSKGFEYHCRLLSK